MLSVPRSRDVLFTGALDPLLVQPVHDGAALVAEGAARLVGVLLPGVRALVLQIRTVRRRETCRALTYAHGKRERHAGKVFYGRCLRSMEMGDKEK